MIFLFKKNPKKLFTKHFTFYLQSGDFLFVEFSRSSLIDVKRGTEKMYN